MGKRQAEKQLTHADLDSDEEVKINRKSKNYIIESQSSGQGGGAIRFS